MRKKIFIFLTLFWIAFIFYNSLQPAPESMEVSVRFVRIIGNLLERFGIVVEPGRLSLIVRKTAHAVEFFVLALLFYPLCSGKKGKYAYVSACCLAVASVDETIQVFVPGRAGSPADVAIDMAGACLACLSLIVLRLLLKKSGKKNQV